MRSRRGENKGMDLEVVLVRRMFFRGVAWGNQTMWWNEKSCRIGKVCVMCGHVVERVIF
jgi:hypothetical protein